MRKDYKTIYYDNYDTDNYLTEDDFKESLHERFSDEEIKCMSESQLNELFWDEYYEIEKDEFDLSYNSFINYFSDKTLLAKGSCGRWNGTSHGVVLINFGSLSDYSSLENFLSTFLSDCDYFKVGITRDNKIFIQATHHDGTNYTEFKVVTEKGEDLYEGHYHENRLPDYNDSELLQKLWKSRVYSEKLPTDFNLYDYS